MANVHSHYDNLQVARSASIEVIRGAYKYLSQKYHPDRNPGDQDAARIMACLNVAYDVLSDPEKRKKHDAWIKEEEASGKPEAKYSSEDRQARDTAFAAKARPPSATTPPAPPQPLDWFDYIRKLRIQRRHLSRWIWTAAGVSVVICLLFLPGKQSQMAQEPDVAEAAHAPVASTYSPVVPAYILPATTPKGQPWPLTASYMAKYPRLNANGHSIVTIDNTENDSDVMVKLASLDGPQAIPVRTFFIPAKERFILVAVTAGSYDIRYRDLVTGAIYRSDPFLLSETEKAAHTVHSDITVALYKVKDGTMKRYDLQESEFQ